MKTTVSIATGTPASSRRPGSSPSTTTCTGSVVPVRSRGAGPRRVVTRARPEEADRVADRLPTEVGIGDRLADRLQP